MTSKWVRASNNSKPSDWVGKCVRCKTWRTAEHTIINRVTGDRYCMFDGGAIQVKCSACNGSGKVQSIVCLRCNGTGMDIKPVEIRKVIQ